MKCVLMFITILTIANGQLVQQWGFVSPGSELIHQEQISWQNPSPNQHQMQRTFRFPRFVEDEPFLPEIGAIVATHEHRCPNTNAQLSWGGPFNRYVGLELESAPGECIETSIEIYSR